jgi:hypothetical protein
MANMVVDMRIWIYSTVGWIQREWSARVIVEEKWLSLSENPLQL